MSEYKDVASSYPKAAVNIVYSERHEGCDRYFEEYLERLSSFLCHEMWLGLTEYARFHKYKIAVGLAQEYLAQRNKYQDEIVQLRAEIARLTYQRAMEAQQEAQQ